MPVNSDFSDLFSAFNDADVRYLLVGGYAVSFYSAPRFTKDLDIWVEPSTANAEATYIALAAFGAPMAQIVVTELARPGMVIQIGVPPNRIDIMTSIEGVEFEGAWASRVHTSYGDVPMRVIGKRELIINKRACGRPQDLVDADVLEKTA